jgi:hypothetical protein
VLELRPGMRAQHAHPMGQHDALRHARASTREEDDMRIGLEQATGPDIVRPLRVRLVAEVGERDDRNADLLPHCGSVNRMGAVHDEQRRSNQSDHRDGLARRQQATHRREHGAHLGEAGEQGCQVEVGVAPHRDPVAERDTGNSGHLIGPLVQLGEGELAVAESDGKPVRDASRGVPDDVPDEKRLLDQNVDLIFPDQRVQT